MKKNISIDLIRDVAKIKLDELIQFGCPKNKMIDWNHDRIIIHHLSVCNRTIEKKPRKIYKSANFQCPLKHKSNLKKLERKIRRGEELNHYISRTIRDKPQKVDSLFYAWGIHHLHLNIHIKSNGFSGRTTELLFCYITQDCAYLIDIKDHKSFEDKELLQIIYDNWPQVISENKYHGTGDDLTQEEIKELRRKNINSIVALADGTAYFPIKGGTTFQGYSVKERMMTDQLIEELKSKQKLILHNMDAINEKAMETGKSFSDKIDFRLFKDERGRLVIRDVHSNITLFLDQFN